MRTSFSCEALGPLPYDRYRVAAHHQRHARGQHQHRHQGVPQTTLRAPVRNLAKPPDQSRLRVDRFLRQLGLPLGQVGELAQWEG